ncbi:MAG: phage shock protein operon transcriptional activator [Halioglobus sp.]
MNQRNERMIGNSVNLAAALDHISELASINRPILICGERGTGKELAAERLHFLSPRWDAPLHKVNCAAIAEPLLESELFGHEAGAFTGATRAHQGRFERADGGTLFLDELGNMSQRLQEKLLRVIEYSEFERVGGQQTLQVDVRIVGATNADLPQMAKQGKFRADLLDRLSFDVVHLPALHQRPEDILELAEHFAMKMSAELGWALFPGFEESTVLALQAHRWPGNVRELKNVVERSVYRWGNPAKKVETLILDPFKSPFPTTDDSSVDAKSITSGEAIADFNSRVLAIEKQMLEEAMAENGHNQRLTAQALGLSYDQLRGMVRKHQIGGQRRRN